MNKYKIFMIFGISILVIALIGSTFAWYSWNTTSENETKISTSIGGATVYFDGGSDINDAKLRPVESKEYGITKEIKVKANTTGLVFNMYLDLITLPDNLKHESLRYAFYQGSTLVTEGNFSTTYLTSNTSTCTRNSATHITLLSNASIPTSNTTYKLYIWIDGANYTNPNTMMNQSFSFKLHADGENAILKEGPIPDISKIPESQKKTLAYKILSDYYYAEKADITNNSVTYHQDTTHNLMSDVGGNVRYYGASPNNYIYFNCETYPGTNCETWRIIGVFDGKVKIMRGSIIGSYSWDNKNTSTGAERSEGKNDWTTARLMKLLNPSDYYTIDSNDNGNGQSLYYNAQSGTCFSGQNNATKSCNFTSTGIKNDMTRNMIAEVTWNLGGHSGSSVYPDTIYETERGTSVYPGRPTTWTGKIALAYPSDYGYAADLSKCIDKNISSYANSTCKANNWMMSIMTSDSWLLTHRSSYSYYVWYVYSSGNANQVGNVFNAYGVVPVLYLSSTLEIESGDGSSSNPYKLSV